MKKLIAGFTILTMFVVGGTALADDPDGTIQQARDALAQADALLAQEQAKPPFVTTVTETITATVTQTVTATVTETVTVTPTSPPTTTTTPPPPTGCTGTNVAPGMGLRAAMDVGVAGTTYCLQSGTYTINSTIYTQDGDKVFGAGRDSSFIDCRGLAPTAGVCFRLTGSNQFRDFEVFGAPTPPVGGASCRNQQGVVDNTWCGQAFRNYGATHTFTRIDCRDNGGNCIGGASSLVINDLNCWNNGNAWSMTSSWEYAGCLKQAAAYTQGANNVTLTNSFIHDNRDMGLWCDFCKYGTWVIHDNVFARNTGHAIQWEMSGGWTTDDSAHVYANTFTDNGSGEAVTFHDGGIHISTANDILFENNTFTGDNRFAIDVIFTASRNPPQPDSRGIVIRNNTMNSNTVTGCGLAGVSCLGNV